MTLIATTCQQEESPRVNALITFLSMFQRAFKMLENGELIISQCGQLFALLLVLWNFSTAIVVSYVQCVFLNACNYI